MPPTPRTNPRASFSQFFRRARPQHALNKFSGTSRSVYCQIFSPVRRLQLDKTPKNRNAKNQKNGELRTAFCPSGMAPFSLKLWESAFRNTSNISYFAGMAMNGVRRSLNGVRCSAFCSDLFSCSVNAVQCSACNVRCSVCSVFSVLFGAVCCI